MTRARRSTADANRLRLFLVALVVAVIPVLLDPGAVQRAASLHRYAVGPQPFFVSEQAWLLYLWTPTVVLSASVLFLTPGLLIVLAFGRVREWCDWMLHSFAVSLLVVSAVPALLQALLSSSVRGALFSWSLVGVASLCAALAVYRNGRDDGLSWPEMTKRSKWAAGSMAVVPFAILVTLSPKFYWENFNGDGAHAYESARLLLVQALPFWPANASALASFPGLTSMLFAFPSSWYIRTFGELEASARFPLLIYLPALFAAIVAIARFARGVEFRRAETVLLWLTLVSYTIAMAFSATYSPYSADIALPATQDTLLVVCFLGFVLAFLRNERGWMTAFLALTYFSLPSGLILVGFWVVAAWLLVSPRPRSQTIWTLSGLIALTAAGLVLPKMLSVLSLPVPGREYGPAGMLRYFAFLQFTDIRRLLYIAIPSGLVPVASLFLLTRQDGVARALTFVTSAYFLFFFVQANISLHHFVPAMLLPIAVFWRVAGHRDDTRTLWTAAGLAGAIVALVMTMPPTDTIYVAGRLIGATIDNQIEGYARVGGEQAASSLIVQELFPVPWSPGVPDKTFTASSTALNYYVRHGDDESGVSGPAPINYIVQQRDRPAPAGARLFTTQDQFALYVRDDAVWQSQLALRPGTPPGSRWLAVPRSTLFHAVPATDGIAVIDVAATLKQLGLDPAPLLRRLGVSR